MAQLKKIVAAATQALNEFFFGLKQIDAERKKIIDEAVQEVDAKKISIIKEKITKL